MTTLRQALTDYLDVRRALGYRMERHEKLLSQFLTYLKARGVERVTIQTAIDWATLPRDAHPSWLSARLSVVRGFARHLHALDPGHEVPPSDLLPSQPCRATPYLYADEDVAAIVAAAAMLRTPHCTATYRTLIGLLAVTGMRVGEAIALDRSDFDSSARLLTIRRGKFGKSRQLPVHPTTAQALRDYLDRPDRPRQAQQMPALLLSTRGTRLLYASVQCTFGRLVRRAGLKERSLNCRPRLHDLRHSFAVHTLLDGYRQEGPVGPRLALLSTYLGHVNPGNTYYYLSAAPELLALAGTRLEREVGLCGAP